MDWRFLGQVFCFIGGPVAAIAGWEWYKAVHRAGLFADPDPGVWPAVCIIGAVFTVVGIGLVAAAQNDPGGSDS